MDSTAFLTKPRCLVLKTKLSIFYKYLLYKDNLIEKNI